MISIKTNYLSYFYFRKFLNLYQHSSKKLMPLSLCLPLKSIQDLPHASYASLWWWGQRKGDPPSLQPISLHLRSFFWKSLSLQQFLECWNHLHLHRHLPQQAWHWFQNLVFCRWCQSFLFFKDRALLIHQWLIILRLCQLTFASFYLCFFLSLEL